MMENGVAIAATCAAVLFGSFALLRHIYRNDPIFYHSPPPELFNKNDFLRIPESDTKPIVGDLPFIQNIRHRLRDWTTTFMNAAAENGDCRPLLFKLPFCHPFVLFNDPVSVEHILKTKFHIYPKVSIYFFFFYHHAFIFFLLYHVSYRDKVFVIYSRTC